MKQIINKNEKWVRFREEREVIIDKYIKAKRKSKALAIILKQYFLRCIIKKLGTMVIYLGQKRMFTFRCSLLVFKIKYKWKRLLKRFGGSTEKRQED